MQTTGYLSAKRNIVRAGVCFLLSLVITAWFISLSPLYISVQQEILSGSIAAGKWLLQVIAAFIFLENKKWIFLKNISVTCLIGSLILLPYSISSILKLNSSDIFFIGSIFIAIVAMIISYYKSVLNAGINIQWWVGWLACLAIAVTLQLTIVFHVIT